MKNIESEIIAPKKQLNLFGYDEIFNSFINLYKKNEMPKVILLNGQEGLGKATFAYHFFNYLLSSNEKYKYDIENNKIDPNNSSYKLINNGIHPNFFLLDSISSDDNIKIDQVRELLKFLSKTSYSRDLKLIILDNANNLNLNSSNALLKILEEPPQDTFIFIVHNGTEKILDTIKSRSIEFKISFNNSKKKEIFESITKITDLDIDPADAEKFINYISPGSALKYLMTLKNLDLDIQEDKFSCLLNLIEKYKASKDQELFNITSFFIELFYNEVSLNNNTNIHNYHINKNKILNQINDMRKFNLDKKNILISVNNILRNEKR
tara:strand:- start:18 stop:986 length:969 start_codon:yes stop_codon:yes gene_type:complete